MKMKKLFLLVCIVFSFIACENIETLETPPALTKNQKTVRLQYFPVDFEARLESALEKKGWTVSVSIGKESIEVGCYNLTVNVLGYGTGLIKFTDLRTGKRIAVYEFTMADPDVVLNKIVEILQSIPGA